MMDRHRHLARLQGQPGSLAGPADPPLNQAHPFRLRNRPESLYRTIQSSPFHFIVCLC